MQQYTVTIKVSATDLAAAQRLGDLLQSAANNVEYTDIVKLLQKVKEKPGIVKTALKFI